MSLFAVSDSKLAQLAASADGPFFAYSRRVALEGWDALKSALPPRVRLAYAVKANPNPELLKLFAERGASFDCASGGELDRAAQALREAGVSSPGNRLFFGGPGKTAAELRRALELGARVQAESLEDLALADRLASGPTAVNLRVHPASGIEEGSRIIGGTGPSAFGVDEEDLPRVLDAAKAYARVRVQGVHVFAASNERDAERLAHTHRTVMDVARRAALSFSLELRQIDLGGGLGIAYKRNECELDIEAMGGNLSALLGENPWFSGELVLEPGRYLAGPCGVYVARVVRVKRSRGTRFVILEGGINHLLRPLLTGQPFPARAFRPDGSEIEGDAEPATLAGPLCTSLDRLGCRSLPPVESGDLVAFGRAGAYGFTEAMSLFLSHPLPAEIWVND